MTSIKLHIVQFYQGHRNFNVCGKDPFSNEVHLVYCMFIFLSLSYHNLKYCDKIMILFNCFITF